MTLRPARDEDAAAIIRVVAGCWAEYPGCVIDVDGEAPELHGLATHMRARRGQAWVGGRAGGVEGVVACWPTGDGDDWELGKMYVAAAARGTGLAQSLLAGAEDHARGRGAAALRLWSDTRFRRAHAFYESHGFLREGPIRALGDRSNSVEFGYAKPLRDVAVRRLDAAATGSAERALARILIACVAAGASVSFLHPLAEEVARSFWHRAASAVAAGKRIVIAAWVDGVLSGVVSLDCDMPPNQPHRGEVQKLLVLPGARRRGVGRALMLALEEAARAAGRTLLTLDTASDAAEALYRSLGYREVGRIPGYALNPDGTRCATLLFYRQLAATPGGEGG